MIKASTCQDDTIILNVSVPNKSIRTHDTKTEKPARRNRIHRSKNKSQ